MFKIGDFARLNKVSVKALRYYDEIGMLKPAKVDSQSGYRYYLAGQIPRLNEIMTLKSIDFSLSDISLLLDNEPNKEKMIAGLQLKSEEMLDGIHKLEAKYERLKALITQLNTEGTMNMSQYDVVVKEVESLKVASIKDTLEDYAQQADIWGELISHLHRHHVKITAPVAVYLDPEAETDGYNFEAAEVITHDIPETGRVKIRQWPEVREMACVMHHGSNERLAEAYTAVQQWMEQNGYRMAGGSRELHWTGYWSGAEPEAHVTEIQIPVVRQD